MTLNTAVYVIDPIDPHEVFRFCQGMLTKYDTEHRRPEAQQWTEKQDSTYIDGAWQVQPGIPWSLDNQPGQDLPAWLMLSHGGGQPLVTPETAAKHDPDWCNIPEASDYDEDEPICDGSTHKPACWLQVNFDTTYGYRDNGMGCGDLHAALVAELGQWLDERGVRWLWKNEYTGEIHDDPKLLIELVADGFAATAWFQTTALPAILAKMNGMV